jgi:hypothetical protein
MTIVSCAGNAMSHMIILAAADGETLRLDANVNRKKHHCANVVAVSL